MLHNDDASTSLISPCSVVTIHSLNGHGDKTWTASNDVHWLSCELPIPIQPRQSHTPSLTHYSPTSALTHVLSSFYSPTSTLPTHLRRYLLPLSSQHSLQR